MFELQLTCLTVSTSALSICRAYAVYGLKLAESLSQYLSGKECR
jgi:hypothetical protein